METSNKSFTLSAFISQMKFRIETVVSVRTSVKKGNYMFTLDLKHIMYWNHEPTCNSRVKERSIISVDFVSFFHWLPVLTRVYTFVLNWAHQRGILSSLLSEQLAGHCPFCLFFASTSRASPSVLQ